MTASALEIVQTRDPVDRRRLIAAFVPKADMSRAAIERFLVAVLSDDEFAVRWAAIDWSLKNKLREGVIETLGECIVNVENLNARTSAMEALGRIGEEAVPTLRRLLSSPNAGVRRLVVDALGIARTDDAVDALSRAARDDDVSVRAAAVESLAQNNSDDAWQVISNVVTNLEEDEAVVMTALLSALQQKRSIARLPLMHWKDSPLVAGAALHLLGRLGEFTLLIDELEHSQGAKTRSILRGLTEACERETAATLRGDLRWRAPTLKQLSSSSTEHALEAAHLLAHAGDLTGLTQVSTRADVFEHEALLSKVLVVLSKSPASSEAKAALKHLKHPDVDRAWPVKSELSNEDFGVVIDFLEKELGLFFEKQAEKRLANRLKPIWEARDNISWTDFVNDARQDSALTAQLADLATIHETYFYRESKQLEAFNSTLVPHYLGTKLLPSLPRPASRLRVWSAGCSTGEEAYTLAIMLNENPQARARGFQIFGSDISQESVDTARAANFGRRSFRGLMPKDWNRYFEGQEAERKLDPAIRARVQFQVLNLLETDASIGQFHVIFCRNVLIYLTKKARAKVIAHFYDRLHEGGVLLLGHSESLLHTDNPFELRVYDKELFYVKGVG